MARHRADYLVDIYADMAQANYPYEAKISVPLPGNPVNAFCSYLNETYDGKELIDVRSNYVKNEF